MAEKGGSLGDVTRELELQRLRARAKDVNDASADLSPGQQIRTLRVDARGSSQTSKWQTNNLYYKVTTSYYSRRLAHVLQPQGTLEGTYPPLAVNGWNQTAFQSPWDSIVVCICCDGS